MADSKEEKKLLKELNLKKLELDALLEITKAINENLPEGSLYKIYQFTLLAQLKIKRIALFVKGKKWDCKVCFGTEISFQRAKIPDTLINLVDISYMSKVEVPTKWRTFDVAVPIVHNGNVLAVVLLGGVLPHYSSLKSLSFVQTVSNIMIVAIENKKLVQQRIAQESVRKEIEIARDVQNMLFPTFLPSNNEVAVHASYIPHSYIGGDYYDYFDIDQNQFLFCVADVSGKGIPASLLMSNFQAGLRTILRQTSDLSTVVSELNHLIYRNAFAEKFITCFLGVYNKSSRELSYVNAGHHAPILLYRNDNVRLLGEGCTMLGIFDVLPFLSVTKVQIPKDSIILCYTDGLTEVFDTKEDEFGIENTIKFLRNSKYMSSKVLHQELLKTIGAFGGEGAFTDDITLLSCRFK